MLAIAFFVGMFAGFLGGAWAMFCYLESAFDDETFNDVD